MESLPLGILSRIVTVNDSVLTLVPLLEKRPWQRKYVSHTHQLEICTKPRYFRAQGPAEQRIEAKDSLYIICLLAIGSVVFSCRLKSAHSYTDHIHIAIASCLFGRVGDL